jgi:hypothetical protein
MTALRFLDTNVPLYSISRDPTETTKHCHEVAGVSLNANDLQTALLRQD